MSGDYQTWLREVREYQDQSRAAAQRARQKQAADYEASVRARMAAARPPTTTKRRH